MERERNHARGTIVGGPVVVADPLRASYLALSSTPRLPVISPENSTKKTRGKGNSDLAEMGVLLWL